MVTWKSDLMVFWCQLLRIIYFSNTYFDGIPDSWLNTQQKVLAHCWEHFYALQQMYNCRTATLLCARGLQTTTSWKEPHFLLIKIIFLRILGAMFLAVWLTTFGFSTSANLRFLFLWAASETIQSIPFIIPFQSSSFLSDWSAWVNRDWSWDLSHKDLTGSDHSWYK